jgi:hypothetical protein
MISEELIQGMEIAAKRGAQYNIEVLNEELIPTLMILTNNDRIEMAHLTGDRDEFPHILKTVLTTKQAKAYVLVLEAWQTSFIEKALELDGRVRDMPLDDRFEVTSIVLVKKNEGITKYLTARIDTQSDGHRTLRDWETGTVQESRLCVTDW